MEENGRDRLDRLYELLFDVKARIRALGFEVPDCGDPFRLVIRDCNAPAIESELASDNVIVEFADADNAVLIPSVMTDTADIERLVSSLERTVKNGFVPKAPDSDSSLPRYFKAVMSLSEAVMAANEVVPINKSIGRICAEAVTPYPPGVPVVMPGEVITKEAVDFAYRRGVDTVRTTI